jgi:hypothetical protein
MIVLAAARPDSTVPGDHRQIPRSQIGQRHLSLPPRLTTATAIRGGSFGAAFVGMFLHIMVLQYDAALADALPKNPIRPELTGRWVRYAFCDEPCGTQATELCEAAMTVRTLQSGQQGGRSAAATAPSHPTLRGHRVGSSVNERDGPAVTMMRTMPV